MNTVIIKKKEDERIRKGHPWIFDNEIDEIRGQPKPGEFLDVVSFNGDLLGQGYMNPNSKIRVRMFSRGYRFTNGDDTNKDFSILFYKRLIKAISKRARLLGKQDAYRVLFSEGDLLPGLIVDRYGSLIIIQFLTLGMEQRRGIILETLDRVLLPKFIYEKYDPKIGRQEGFSGSSGFLKGKNDFPSPYVFKEHGIMIELDPTAQKTGYYLDQAKNRMSVRSFCSGKKVLDCFCYTGAFALSAMAGGATEVVGIDSSGPAIAMAERNAIRNGFSRARFVKRDIFEELRRMQAEIDRYDVVILDPPAFAKQKKDLVMAQRGYHDINRLAMKLVRPGGLLVSCSCSHYLVRWAFEHILRASARGIHRHIRIIEWNGANVDHPTLTEVPETSYLKCVFMRLDV